jgi:hypothetical protein
VPRSPGRAVMARRRSSWVRSSAEGLDEPPSAGSRTRRAPRAPALRGVRASRDRGVARRVSLRRSTGRSGS